MSNKNSLTFINSVSIILVYFIAQIINGIFIGIIDVLFNFNIFNNFYLYYFTHFLVILFTFRYYLKIRNKKMNLKNLQGYIFAWEGLEKRENYTTIFILAFFALALNTNLITYLSNFINFPTGNTLTNLMEYRTPIEVFIISNIWAPVIEEILFRGIILKGLLKEYKVVYAIVFSSILFALVHFYPHQIIISFFAGLILGFIYYKTASLLSVILLHALYNTYIDLLVFLENRFSLEILTILPNKFYIFISLIIILSLLYDLSKNNNYNWQSEEIKYLL